MSLWGYTNVKKPAWLSSSEKDRTFLDYRGWVLRHLNGTEEVLVAISNSQTPQDSLLRLDGEPLTLQGFPLTIGAIT